MKFFIDTANINEIIEAQNYGILDGVTTNPSLMAKEKIKGKKKHYKTLQKNMFCGNWGCISRSYIN